MRKCKECGVIKQRTEVGKYKKDKKFRDGEGLLWNGNICGSCNRVRARKVMQKTRKERRARNA